MRHRVVTQSLIAFLALGTLQCSRVADPHPQLLVFVDTDLPTVGQATLRSDLSFDASIDTVRVDVIGSTSKDTRTFVVPDVQSWPLSFGVPAPAGAKSIRLRIRAYRSTLVSPNDPTVPQPQAAVDRVVDFTFPAAGIVDARVVLKGDCLGIPPAFTQPATTCADGAHQKASPADGVITGAHASDATTLSGSWTPAIELPCQHEPPPGAVCIMGGFTMLGEDGFHGVGDGTLLDFDPNPVRPVELSPFFLDIDEFTVKRLRQVIADNPGAIDPSDLPLPHSVNPTCNFESLTDATYDDLPVNCMTNEVAMRTLCQLSHGDLATEAQWEHAARGRGQHRAYAWGNDPPDCCHANLLGCGNVITPPGGQGCTGSLDVSRDGVHDMTGNMRELTRDKHVGYGSSYWTKPGVLLDPVCDDPSDALTVRGGAIEIPPEKAHLALRGKSANPFDFGLRCSYPDKP